MDTSREANMGSRDAGQRVRGQQSNNCSATGVPASLPDFRQHLGERGARRRSGSSPWRNFGVVPVEHLAATLLRVWQQPQ